MSRKNCVKRNNIKYILLDRKMRQADLARKTGINPAHLNRIINGVITSPDVVTIKRIADALGVTIQDLYDDPPPQVNEQTYHYDTQRPSPALQSILDNKPLREMIGLTDIEAEAMKHIRWRSSEPPTEQFYLDMLKIWRSLK